jgi:hypothetical protein
LFLFISTSKQRTWHSWNRVRLDCADYQAYLTYHPVYPNTGLNEFPCIDRHSGLSTLCLSPDFPDPS